MPSRIIHESEAAKARKPEAEFMRHILQRGLLQVLKAYKWAISPMFPPACRYVPSCSEYAMEAVERYGALRGGFMALARLLRCHPFVKGGYDPVVKCNHPELATNSDVSVPMWKSDASAPHSAVKFSAGFSPSSAFERLKRNA